MQLKAFDSGRVGRIDGDDVIDLDCGTTREWFAFGADVRERGDRLNLNHVRTTLPKRMV